MSFDLKFSAGYRACIKKLAPCVLQIKRCSTCYNPLLRRAVKGYTLKCLRVALVNKGLMERFFS